MPGPWSGLAEQKSRVIGMGGVFLSARGTGVKADEVGKVQE